ncbi:hypothetical protein SAMN05660649_03856 [Desulfotomaculum arcticum]|uniref:Uncharacterized protein n=1 Tax=Desulfotruncus arcticus DSM 17038 TaxID=1121424 RepID=A0A1I2X8Z0_9FIRM|nr:hypothetical protein SAMN05660649_03856 [Desulfotomaculum arcticum] [Desulfotruncus arcticus DSM 17038]
MVKYLSIELSRSRAKKSSTGCIDGAALFYVKMSMDCYLLEFIF